MSILKNKIKFHSLHQTAILPVKSDNGYYTICSPEYLSLGSFEVKELDTLVGIEIQNGYFGIIQPIFNKNIGILVLLNSTINQPKTQLKLTFLNAMYDPREVKDSLSMAFGNRQRITIKPGDEICRLYIVKNE